MILESLHVSVAELQERTGWELNERGACKGDVCVPLAPKTHAEGLVDISILAERLAMPIVGDPKHGIWSLGPESMGGRALTSAVAPHLVLPELRGGSFDLRSLQGQKVLLLAWASW